MHTCNSIMLHNMNVKELSSCFDAIKQMIISLSENTTKSEREVYLTRQEVADMLKIDLSSVHNWSKNNILQPYRIGNRVYYKLSEIESSMLPMPNFKTK